MNISLLRNSFYIITQIFAERQLGMKKSWYERTDPRPSDALLLFTNATAIYRSKNQTPLYVPNGALVYIPRGYIYSIENHSTPGNERIETLLFEFNLMKTETTRGALNKISITPPNGEYLTLGSNGIEILDFKPKIYEYYFSALIDAFESKNASMLSIYHYACSILECLIKNCSSNAMITSHSDIINLALEHLGSFEQPEKSISEIAEACCVSVSGFEKKFKFLTGMTPSAYRMECKLTRAKQLLRDSPKLSLDEISQLCNFDDVAYLCRVFKRKYGITPRKFSNLFQK